ncbi:MAG: hypothetical protein GKR91_04715 [Pseudomonadales bacterium]|nr:hypothetical protein [Pseudomonadales bacterium]
MTNDELLAELDKRLRSGELSAAEIELLLSTDSPDAVVADSAPTASPYSMGAFSITKLLYVVGGIFITLGVLYLVSQLWSDLNSFNRILITLGLGVVFAGFGSKFLMSEPERDLGNVFHTIGGFLIPGGALVTLDELTTGIDSIWPVTITVGVVFAFYVLLVLYHKRVVLNFFAFANGSALAYLLMESIIPSADGDLYAYMTMMIGASYLIYAYVFQEGWNARLIPLLLFFGPLGFYLAAFSQIFDAILMEMLFPFLAFGGLVLAVNVFKSRIVLILSTLAVIGYIIYFTAEYFADSIGWPVALIMLGFIIIGIGYLSITLNRKYLKTA